MVLDLVQPVYTVEPVKTLVETQLWLGTRTV